MAGLHGKRRKRVPGKKQKRALPIPKPTVTRFHTMVPKKAVFGDLLDARKLSPELVRHFERLGWRLKNEPDHEIYLWPPHRTVDELRKIGTDFKQGKKKR